MLHFGWRLFFFWWLAINSKVHFVASAYASAEKTVRPSWMTANIRSVRRLQSSLDCMIF